MSTLYNNLFGKIEQFFTSEEKDIDESPPNEESDDRTQVFENVLLKVSVTKLPNCIARFSCKPNEKFTLPLKEKAIEQIKQENGQNNIARVSDDSKVLEKLVSEKIEKIWKEMIVGQVSREALKLAELKVVQLSQTSVEGFDISADSTCTINFQCEVQPEVPPIKYSKFKMPEIEKRPITKEMLEKVLLEQRYSLGIWRDLNHPLQNGDFVVLDVFDLEAREKLIEGATFEMDETTLPPWIYKNIIGKNAGDSIKADSEVDPSAPEELRAKFKSHQCKISIQGVKEVILPDLNDQFAMKFGAKSMDELEKINIARFEATADADFQQRHQDAFIANLSKAFPFDVPNSHIEKQKEGLRASLKDRELTKQEKRNLHLKAIDLVRAHFIMQKIAKKEKIVLSSEEVISYLDKTLKGDARLVLFDPSKKQEKMRLIKVTAEQLMHGKAMEIIISKKNLPKQKEPQ